MKILIAYDGTVHSKKALRYGIDKIVSAGGELTVLQVFDRSLFVDYDAGPRAEELARAEAAKRLDEAKAIIDGSACAGSCRIVLEEGDAAAWIGKLAAELRPGLALLPPRFRSLARSLPCPAMTVPGTVLVPVDATGSGANLESITGEAAATGSDVLLLGIVPVHLYSREERKELRRVQKNTAATVKQLKAALKDKGVASREAMAEGYPDEEILKAAAAHAVSLILLPSGSTTPSELSKAAAILLDEPDRLKWPVFLVPSAAS